MKLRGLVKMSNAVSGELKTWNLAPGICSVNGVEGYFLLLEIGIR